MACVSSRPAAKPLLAGTVNCPVSGTDTAGEPDATAVASAGAASGAGAVEGGSTGAVAGAVATGGAEAA